MSAPARPRSIPVAQTALEHLSGANDDAPLRAFLKTYPLHGAPPGTVLFEQGAPADRFFFISDGLVETTMRTHSGEDTIIDATARGAIIGGLAVLGGAHYPVSAQTVIETHYVGVPADLFLEKLRDDDALFLDTLAQAVHAVERIVAATGRLKLQLLSQRIAGYLLSLCPDRADGPARVHLPFSKRSWAAHLGATPQSLSRSLRQLQKYGVTVRSGAVMIENIKEIRGLFEEEGGI
ncbi:Crp/Fnr family transcriptional regulator [Varunaivibrio sulfuroxidans]|uniref:CRP/FNR family transcriptional activator FtrB n=1 Tax=Varunaivibrio sulfuroxidans TaxID=1773489 RepID=A0A4R3JIS1_9PROT|nr:cyclic nucleotide-binding domain-containing protein [Varunaivibrio sulfuroxidans]TCS64710.1 CRP/FNR family transcriptional activator FtrB [Varunaivibrio sulfuroxidans]WES29984.1 helix-turn-helix domain-containing protein [Varunaivibrio sulfuroxidans]